MSVVFAFSVCDFNVGFLKSHGVEVINAKLNINGKKQTYKADNFNFAEYFEAGNYNVSFEKLDTLIYGKIKQALQTGQDVVVIAPSKEFDCIFKESEKAKQQLELEFPDQKIVVIDSGLVSAAYGAIVFEAAVLNSTGIRAQDLAKKINAITKNYELLIIPNEVNAPLKQFSFGKALGVKPIISLSKNKLELVSNVKGKLKLTSDVLLRIKLVGYNIADYLVCIMYGKSNLLDAEKLKLEIQKQFDAEVSIAPYCPTLTQIVGDNALLISYHKRNA